HARPSLPLVLRLLACGDSSYRLALNDRSWHHDPLTPTLARGHAVAPAVPTHPGVLRPRRPPTGSPLRQVARAAQRRRAAPVLPLPAQPEAGIALQLYRGAVRDQVPLRAHASAPLATAGVGPPTSGAHAPRRAHSR